jgi:hypothetical protein
METLLEGVTLGCALAHPAHPVAPPMQVIYSVILFRSLESMDIVKSRPEFQNTRHSDTMLTQTDNV